MHVSFLLLNEKKRYFFTVDNITIILFRYSLNTLVSLCLSISLSLSLSLPCVCDYDLKESTFAMKFISNTCLSILNSKYALNLITKTV